MAISEEDLNFLKAFAIDENDAVARFYDVHKTPFFAFILKYFPCTNRDDIDDIFQDSILEVYKNVKRGKLSEKSLTSSLKSYLYGIGKNLAMTRFRTTKVCSPIDDYAQSMVVRNIPDDDKELDVILEREDMLSKIVEEMGEPCKPLLECVYWRSMSGEDIAVELNYANANSVKVQKYKCMQKLKLQFKKVLNYE